jgi:hypothetical protein
MDKLNRREFVSLTAAAFAGACAFCNAGMLLAESADAGAAPVEVGALSDYGKDGITEALNPQKQLFSEERLRVCLDGARGRDVGAMVEAVRAKVREFAQGEPQSDDITMLVITYNGGPQ